LTGNGVKRAPELSVYNRPQVTPAWPICDLRKPPIPISTSWQETRIQDGDLAHGLVPMARRRFQRG
jgi:hypothetical protein